MMLPVISLCASAVGGELPPKADLRPEFIAAGLTPKSQGNRGTCSLFAVVGVLEYEYAQAGEQSLRLSEEYVNWASHNSNGRRSDGSFFSDAVRGMRISGVCRQDLMPYVAQWNDSVAPSVDAVKDAAKRTDIAPRWIKHWNVKTGLTTAQMQAIKSAIAGGHPVAVGMRWPKNVRFDADGVIAYSDGDEVFDGHSIVYVGYEDDAAKPGGGVFIFRNSSGPEWREAGHSRLSYAYVREFANDALELRVGTSDKLPRNSEAADPVEFDDMKAASPDGVSSARQSMASWGKELWSGGDQIICHGRQGDVIEFEFAVDAPGAKGLCLFATKAPDYGVVQVRLDGRDMGEPIDLYSPEVVPTGRINLGDVRLETGAHRIAFTIKGRNIESSGCAFGLDCIELSR